MTSTLFNVSNARRVMSPRLPIGVGTRYKEIFLSTLSEFVYRVGELSVEIGDFVSSIVCIQLKVDGVVGVGPGGMMIHFLRHQGHFGHESKGFLEIFELK